MINTVTDAFGIVDSKMDSRAAVNFWLKEILKLSVTHTNFIRSLYFNHYTGPPTPISDLSWIKNDMDFVKKAYEKNPSTLTTVYQALWKLADRLHDTEFTHKLNDLQGITKPAALALIAKTRAKPTGVTYDTANAKIDEMMGKIDKLTIKENYALRWLLLFSSKTTPPLRTNDYGRTLIDHRTKEPDEAPREPTIYLLGKGIAIGYLSSKKSAKKYGITRHEFSERDANILEQLYLAYPSIFVLTMLTEEYQELKKSSALDIAATLALKKPYQSGNAWRRQFESEVIDKIPSGTLKDHYRKIMGHSHSTANKVYIAREATTAPTEDIDEILTRAKENTGISHKDIQAVMNWLFEKQSAN